jgi:chromosome segregation protein
MKIKRLDVSGFKSFVDKTTLTFPEPITAIVGPNGCGKSNIVDAIRWVMGEQSAKHLRGRAMEDVIFAGSESRGPSGFAEVSLTFDTENLAGDAASGGVPWGAAGPSEVVVTRRLYRDGTSEYLLGGVPCRLRDIVDFFLGTGVGSKAYSIIEQGRIGFIVSSKPEDRRGIIDEAAGITKYKAKKKLAERRMDATRQHLLRVSDIIGEIETRLRSLRLAAQKAERYKRYKSELRDLELWQASQRFLGLLAEEKSLQTLVIELGERHEEGSGALSTEEAAVEAERVAVTEELAELATLKEELFALTNRADLGMQRSQHYAEEAAALVRRAEAARREIEDLTTRSAEAQATMTAIEGQLSELDRSAETRREEYESLEEVHEDLRAQMSSSRRMLDEAQAQAAGALARVARLESEIENGEARREDLGRRLGGVATEDGALAEQLAAAQSETGSVEARIAELRARKEDLALRREESQARVAELKSEVARGEVELDTLREESHRRRSRLQSLSEIQTRYESFQRGVRAIMKQYKQRSADDAIAQAQPWSTDTAIRGLVADIVQPPPDLETAVEAVLGDRLGNIIVESHEVGVDAIEFLKNRSEGRSSFIPLSLRVPQGEVLYDAGGGTSLATTASPGGAVPVMWPDGEGVRGPMLELIGYDRQYDRVAAYLLGDVVVVEDLRKALALWRETRSDKTIVTLDGEVIDPHGVVTGGSRESAVAGILSQKREIRELEEVVAKIESDYEAALQRHVSRKQALAETTAILEELTTAARQDEVALVSLGKDLDRAGRERASLEMRRKQLANQEQQLRGELAKVESRLAEAGAALEQDRQTSFDADERAGALRAEAVSLADRLDEMVGQLASLKVAASQAADRRTNARDTLERLRRERTQQDERRERLEVTTAEELARVDVLRTDAAKLREEASLWQAEAEERARAHNERQGAVEARSTALARREAELRAARARVAEIARELASVQLRSQEATLRRSSLEEQVAGKYRDVSLAGIVFDHHLRPPVGPDEEARMAELRGLIERMGEINLTAIEESAELQKRFDYLTTQKADLESAISQLESAIEKINKASRKRFKEVFDAINEKFQEIFPRCFGGGRAKLGLTDEADMLETGVEINANPPGKKVMQNIELLSGGEKAMTAVSLLFAIFLVKPSPFCVLDEVDAPLDEANVGRFNQMVREMTDRSQFIIITHNRRTMEIADRLCGVTMEEPGVSKLVAVNLRGSKMGKGSIGTQPPVAGDSPPGSSAAAT